MYLPQIIDDWDLTTNVPTGLTISEDDKYVYVSASLPGVDPKDVEVTFDKGVVWIKGEASSSFSYRIAVPGDIDAEKDPEATSKHGVMTVKFTKKPQSQPKKITVKSQN